jgi:AcrR family transcriptional regulator
LSARQANGRATADPSEGGPNGGTSGGGTNQEKILDVATREFAEKGLAGARVAEIAEQAGVNKQLLYYYFGSKEGLYSAVLSSTVSTARSVIVGRPEGESAIDWFTRSLSPSEIERRRTLRRLWMWEALERGGEEILREEERREAWERAVDVIRERMSRGEIDADMDPEMVMLGLDAVMNAPYMLPQVTKLITGMDPNDEAFRERHVAFLCQLLEALSPRA